MVRTLFTTLILFTVTQTVFAQENSEKVPRKPVLIGEPWKITTMPDLGELAGPNPDKQHIVDHGIIQDANDDWRLWACIRGTAVSRLIYGWKGESLEEGPWEPTGVAMRAQPKYGERIREGKEHIGAPHFIKVDDTWHCFYHSAGM